MLHLIMWITIKNKNFIETNDEKRLRLAKQIIADAKKTSLQSK